MTYSGIFDVQHKILFRIFCDFDSIMSTKGGQAFIGIQVKVKTNVHISPHQRPVFYEWLSATVDFRETVYVFSVSLLMLDSKEPVAFRLLQLTTV
jgi:hypothetical protein